MARTNRFKKLPVQADQGIMDASGDLELQTVQVALTAAQILALNATPVTLVPAQGANTVIIVSDITFKMVTTATQYANGGVLEFRYTNASGQSVANTILAAVVTAGAGTSYTSRAGIDVTSAVNAPIVIDNATAPFITGTGTAVITIQYRVESF